MPFAVSKVWREQSDHVTDCYFCMTAIRGFSRKNNFKISYPVCKSAIRPVPHSPDLPVPQPPTKKEDSLSVNACESISTESEEEPIELDPSFQHESAPLFINQERLNDLGRDLYLSKDSRNFGVQASTMESTGTRNNYFIISWSQSESCWLLCKC